MHTPTILGGALKLQQAVLLGLLLLSATAYAQQFGLESLGVRGGASLTDPGENFRQVDLFLNCNLPWRCDLGRRWKLQSRLDLAGGWLGDAGVNAAIGSIGLSGLLAREGFPFSLEGGVSPTGITRHEFPDNNLGGPFQITTYIGVNWEMATHFRLGYHFQHMSNADIYTPNPGLNMHMLGLSYLF
jgi:hypothetical protein